MSAAAREFGVTAGPGSEVVERLLGPDRRTVEAKQEYLSRRIVLGANHCVIEPREQHLARGCRGDDRLDRGVVFRCGIHELLHAGQQLLSAQFADAACGPVADDPAVAQMPEVRQRA